MNSSRRTPLAIRQQKGKSPLVCLTAYTYSVAKWADAHVDLLLVGDSMGMVIYGLPNTLGVTLEMIIRHSQAVVRGASQACIVADLPFGSYEAGKVQAFASAQRLLGEGQAQAVKLEGGQSMAETVAFLSQRSIPVMGHVGLTPQAVNVLGGFSPRGMSEAESEIILKDAQAIAQAGAFALVVEAVPYKLGAAISAAVDIPVIGIGAGPDCDGQILVTEDMLGIFNDFKPKFVRHFARVGQDMEAGFAAYASAVRQRQFPSLNESYASPKT